MQSIKQTSTEILLQNLSNNFNQEQIRFLSNTLQQHDSISSVSPMTVVTGEGEVVAKHLVVIHNGLVSVDDLNLSSLRKTMRPWEEIQAEKSEDWKQIVDLLKRIESAEYVEILGKTYKADDFVEKIKKLGIDFFWYTDSIHVLSKEDGRIRVEMYAPDSWETWDNSRGASILEYKESDISLENLFVEKREHRYTCW